MKEESLDASTTSLAHKSSLWLTFSYFSQNSRFRKVCQTAKKTWSKYYLNLLQTRAPDQDTQFRENNDLSGPNQGSVASPSPRTRTNKDGEEMGGNFDTRVSAQDRLNQSPAQTWDNSVRADITRSTDLYMAENQSSGIQACLSFSLCYSQESLLLSSPAKLKVLT